MSTAKEDLISSKDAKLRIDTLGDKSSNESACIIFGAGASSGYSYRHTYTPPSIKDLFNESNPVVNEVINLEKNLFIKYNKEDFSRGIRYHENDLEKYLSFLYSKNRNDNRFNRFLTYLEDIFSLASQDIVMGEPNNYRTLINRMWDLHGIQKKWSCISFNYDTILESSYLMADRDTTKRNFSSITSYIDFNPAILKMHGSINFRYIFREPRYALSSGLLNTHDLFSKMMTDSNGNFLNVIELTSKKPNFKSVKTIYTKEKNSDFFEYNFPLMLIPIHASITHENIFFKESLDLAKKQIENSNLIIAIGYNFGDEAFNDVLGKIDHSKKEIILVDTAFTIKDLENYPGFQKIKKTWSKAKIRAFDGDGFDDFMKAIS